MKRRTFFKTAGAAGLIGSAAPNLLLGAAKDSPNEKLNIGIIGSGGRGAANLRGVSSENIVALCDVNVQTLEAVHKKYPKAKKYTDWRKMMDDKSIDAVTVSTPDHFHAVAAITAIKQGKHAFVQKPLTYSVDEAQKLSAAAKKAGVVTQMGNQGHAGEGIRLIGEWLKDDAIGEVREVHCWTNRPIWDTGMNRPAEIPSVPPTLDWNQWIGPAPFRPYHPDYAPWSWRAWCDFGTGALGDMGAHIFDIPYHTLKMDHPTSVFASSSKFNGESWPVASTIYYEFPQRGSLPPVKLTWYDGGIMPSRPEGIEPGRRMGDGDGGIMFYGDKGMIMCGCYGRNPRLVPETSMKEYQRPPKTLSRSPGIHEEWVQCIKESKQASSNFDYAARLTSTMLLGNIAIRMAPRSTKLEWDGIAGKFTNMDEANDYLGREYRDGWNL